MENTHNQFSPRAYTKKELRLLYGIPESTFRRWLKALPELSESGQKNWLNIAEVLAIVSHYGIPGDKSVEEELTFKYKRREF